MLLGTDVSRIGLRSTDSFFSFPPFLDSAEPNPKSNQNQLYPTQNWGYQYQYHFQNQQVVRSESAMDIKMDWIDAIEQDRRANSLLPLNVTSTLEDIGQESSSSSSSSVSSRRPRVTAILTRENEKEINHNHSPSEQIRRSHRNLGIGTSRDRQRSSYLGQEQQPILSIDDHLSLSSTSYDLPQRGHDPKIYPSSVVSAGLHPLGNWTSSPSQSHPFSPPANPVQAVRLLPMTRHTKSASMGAMPYIPHALVAPNQTPATTILSSSYWPTDHHRTRSDISNPSLSSREDIYNSSSASISTTFNPFNNMASQLSPFRQRATVSQAISGSRLSKQLQQVNMDVAEDEQEREVGRSMVVGLMGKSSSDSLKVKNTKVSTLDVKLGRKNGRKSSIVVERGSFRQHRQRSHSLIHLSFPSQPQSPPSRTNVRRKARSVDLTHSRRTLFTSGLSLIIPTSSSTSPASLLSGPCHGVRPRPPPLRDLPPPSWSSPGPSPPLTSLATPFSTDMFIFPTPNPLSTPPLYVAKARSVPPIRTEFETLGLSEPAPTPSSCSRTLRRRRSSVETFASRAETIRPAGSDNHSAGDVTPKPSKNQLIVMDTANATGENLDISWIRPSSHETPHMASPSGRKISLSEGRHLPEERQNGSRAGGGAKRRKRTSSTTPSRHNRACSVDDCRPLSRMSTRQRRDSMSGTDSDTDVEDGQEGNSGGAAWWGGVSGWLSKA